MVFKQKCICLVVLCFISYYNSLQGEFVFDDDVAIVKNRDVTNNHQKQLNANATITTTTRYALTTSLQEIFHHDFWGYNLTDPTSHKSYRPLTTLMFHLEYKLFNGLNSFGMKSINLLLHSINTILVLKLFTALISTAEISFLGAILFAIHPIHTEAVCGIVGRAELLFGFFFLIALIIYSNPNFGIQSNFKLLPKFGVLIGISLIALLCKENAISILPTCATFDLTIRTNLFQRFESRFRMRRAIFYRSMILLGITGLLLYGRLYLQDFEKPNFKSMDNPIAFNDDFVIRILSQNYLYVLNSWILLCPIWLSFDWALGCVQLLDSFLDLRILLIVVFWMIIYRLLLSSSRIVLLATILIIVPFLPASGILKLGFVIAERILYVPSIGFCLLIAIGFGYLVDKYQSVKQIFYCALIILLVVFIFRTRQRGSEWKTGEKLYNSALDVCPNNAKVHYNIARVAADHGEKKKAFEHYHKAIQLYPKYEAALMNLGNLYREIGDMNTAEMYLKKSIEELEEFAAAWMNLGIVQASQKKYNEAEASYHKALSYRKNYSSCLYNLGNLYLEMRNFSLAMKYWHESVALNPKLTKAWANMLTLLDNRGLHEDVLHIADRALKFWPSNAANTKDDLSSVATITFIKANVLGKLKRYDEAEKLYLNVIQMNSNNSLYQLNLGVLYHRWGKKKNAIERYETALRLDPNSKNAKDNLQKLRHTIMN